MRPQLLLSLIGALVFASMPAAREITLSEALDLAREHSLEVRRATAEQLAAEEALEAAKAAKFPTLDATALTFYNTDVASLEVPTPSGALSREVGTKDNYQIDLRLAMPFYTGGRIEGGINAAGASYRQQAALTEAALDEVLYRVRVEYLRVLLSDQGIEAAQSGLRRARLTREQVESLLSAGAADSVAVLEAQLAINEAELSLQQAHTDRRIAQIRLSQLLGLPVSDTLLLTTNLPTPQEPESVEAPNARAELLAASAAVDLGRAQAEQAESGWYPSLSAFGGYSYGKPNLDRFNNTWNDYWQIGARLQWSFNLGLGTKHQVNRAKGLVRAAESRREYLDEQFRGQQLIAWENLALAFAQYQTARDRATISRRNYQLAQSQHSEGVLSTNRLLEIEATLNQAEATLAVAEAGYYIARSSYFYASGADLSTEGF